MANGLQIPEQILLIAERLRTQDNRITSHPIFMVQERPDARSKWTNLQPCLTNAAAEAFIERQSHNYRHLRVYVASGYDNPEWRIVRDWLMSLTPATNGGHDWLMSEGGGRDA